MTFFVEFFVDFFLNSALENRNYFSQIYSTNEYLKHVHTFLFDLNNYFVHH